MAQLPWHTSVSILVAGGMVAGAVYLALRPSTSPTPSEDRAPKAAARPDEGFASSLMAERDRQRRWDDAPESESESEPAPSGEGRSEKPVSEAELAMAVAAPLDGPSTPEELTERLQQDAGEAFEGIRKRVRSDCWDTLPDDPEAPDEVDVVLSLSYAADGKLLASGINESRAGYRAGLSACLAPLVQELDVPAPGSNQSIELRVTIP
jgi:hypothetical protein